MKDVLFKSVAGVSLCLFSLFSYSAESDFPYPDSLEPAVNFWVRVYTEVDTSSGFLHDSESLDVVYVRLDRERQLINSSREQIQKDLLVLASGKREGLSQEQQRLLTLWPESVSNERLAQAAENIRWQLGQADRFVAGVKRSGAYRAHIEQVVVNKGMPIELASLPHVESSFHPGAYSSASATGMWQFVRSTAQRFMQVDYVVDDRLDPYTASYGAMELLEFNYNALGTWPLALTAYNHGANGMARAVSQTGTTDIAQIIDEYKGPRFRFASRNFYPQFLAVLEVERRQEEFFGLIEVDAHPIFVEFELPAYVDAKTLADVLEVDFNELRRRNPALQPSVWSGTKRIPRGYTLKLDQQDFSGDMVLAFANLPDSELYSEQIPDVSYVVSRGDSLSVIADRYSVPLSQLVAINQLRDRNRIRIGQTLLLPQPDGGAPSLDSSTPNVAGQPWDIPEDGRYEVMRGDTLSMIATRFSLSLEQLLSFNNMQGNDYIFPGQDLALKEASAEESIEIAQIALDEENALNVEQQVLNHEVREEVITLEQLPLDSNNLALDVSDQILALEERQQLEVDLAADPADYSIDENNTIEIQTTETLGHYADWLGIRASDLRRLNNLRFIDPVIIGQRLTLSFDVVSREAFSQLRGEYHRDLQQSYFNQWRIQETETYTIESRDRIARLARRRDIPMWLFRQYNPDVDANNIRIGQQIVFPQVEQVTD